MLLLYIFFKFINVGKFWVQHDDESTRNELREIQRSLNSRPLLAVTGDVAVDDLVTAPYADGTTTLMYRARITRILPRDMLEVRFIQGGDVYSNEIHFIEHFLRDIMVIAKRSLIVNPARVDGFLLYTICM